MAATTEHKLEADQWVKLLETRVGKVFAVQVKEGRALMRIEAATTDPATLDEAGFVLWTGVGFNDLGLEDTLKGSMAVFAKGPATVTVYLHP